MKKKIVVALGRNSLGDTLPEQKKAIVKAGIAVANLAEDGYDVVVTHSNGPQVGMIHSALNEFSRKDNKYTPVPMSVCTAMSQGYIGYDLQNEIRTQLLERGICKTVSTVITQVRVDAFDEAFQNPTKIVGRYMTKEEADEELEKGNYVVEESNGEYRRIVAAPNPLEIYEIDAIKLLSDAGQIVIAAGGGGIPVLEQNTRLKGASAIIEKDDTAVLLADLLNADKLIFFTVARKAAVNYGKPDEKLLDELSVAEAKRLIEEGHFSKNSMLPKIEDSIKFVEGKPGREALIASLDKAVEGLLEKTGTIIR